MANLKISELGELTEVPSPNDLAIIVDISEPFDINKTKKIKFSNLVNLVSQAQAQALVSGQTAGDLIYAGSATSLARKAIGAAASYLRVNAAGNDYEFGGLVGTFASYASSGVVAHNAIGNLTIQTELYDSHGFVDIASNAYRVTIPTNMGGLYLLIKQMSAGKTVGSGTGKAEVTYTKGTSNYFLGVVADSALLFTHYGMDFEVLTLAAGDYITASYANYMNSNAIINAKIGLLLLART